MITVSYHLHLWEHVDFPDSENLQENNLVDLAHNPLQVDLLSQSRESAGVLMSSQALIKGVSVCVCVRENSI